MKKLNLTRWLLTALAAMTVFSAPAAKKTFTAVTANVDGLPQNVTLKVGNSDVKDIPMNADGSLDKGASRMGQLIGENLWDIVALSEDFNFHQYIMEGVSTYYNPSTHRGIIDQSNLTHTGLLEIGARYIAATPTDSKGLYMKTDGLCLLSRKKYKVTPSNADEGENKNWIPWNDHYGYTDHEADGLIRKGFRFYQVTLAEGLVVDVYITHMEAGSDPEDNAARAKQLTQFAEYIKAHKGTNPIIILGDTNCRYTRDPLKAGFIDLIEQDTDLHVQDPWVQHMRGGDYPEFGTPSLMVSTLGEQKGEVVDKIWYINNDKSECTLTCTGYLHDDSFTYADGSQIADHYPVVGTFIIDDGKEDGSSTEVTIPGAPPKGAIVNGETYYLRNLGSGKFVRAGGNYSTQALMSDYPTKVIARAQSDGTYAFETTHVRDKSNKYLNYYFDSPLNDSKRTLTQVKDNVYRLTYKIADGTIKAVGFNNGVLAEVDVNEIDPNQQWEFLRKKDLMHELYYATSDSPKDVTFLMKNPDFGSYDTEKWTTGRGTTASLFSTPYVSIDIIPGAGTNTNTYCLKASNIQATHNDKWYNISQKIEKLPAGTYIVTYQALTYNLAKSTTGTHSIKINGEDCNWDNVGSDPGESTVRTYFGEGKYTHKYTITVTDAGSIEIIINKNHNSSAAGGYYDNFNIKCIGLDGIPDLSMYERVKVAIDDAKAKAAEAGLTNYRNGQVETLWAEKEITGDGWAEIKRTYKNLGEAVLAQSEIPCDYTYAIVNPSFELYPDYNDGVHTIHGGFPFGWSYPTNYAKDSGVWHKSDNNKKVENGCDGDYIYNTWPEGNTIYQDVTLTPGIYEVTAKVTSSQNNKIYLYAGDFKSSVEISQNADGNNLTLEPITLRFPVTDGKPIKIGVAGEKNGSFALEGGNWYKADDFHLTRIAGVETIEGSKMLQYAIDEVTQRLKNKNWYDTESQNELNRYQAMVDNYTLTGDCKQEFQEVYNIIRAKLFAQPTTNAQGNAIEVDYTYAIPNNSFEWGNTYGWELLAQVNDTGVKPNSEDRYKLNGGCDGTYLFNTWDGNDYGTPIWQTIPNLPAGHYTLEATFASDKGNWVYLEAIGLDADHTQKDIFKCDEEKNIGKTRSLEFDVAEGTPYITLRAGSCNHDGSWNERGGQWYKVDNFRLLRKSDAKICFFYKRLLNAINEANSVAGELPAYYANQWDASDYQDLIDKHLADGHNPEKGETSEKYDPLNGSSGIQEINDLFDRMRTLIFSQQESGADMSGAITNNSFELGDLTGWTTYIEVGEDAQVVAADENTPVYGTKDVDGTYLYNAYYGNRNAHPIYQVIPNMPSGRYTLTVKVASDLGAKFFLGANDKHSKIFYITKDGNRHNILGEDGIVIAENQPGEFCEFSFTFEVPVDAVSKDVKIGVYPTDASSYEEINETHFADDAVGPWYKVDHFRLTLDSRYLEVNWKMETPTHGTIMLPFDVSAEELAAQNLEAYSIKFSEESKTPSDWDVNNYRILNWVGPHDGKEHEDGLHQDGIKAYNPYVLKNIAPVDETESVSAMNAKVSVKAAEGETANDPQANYTGTYYKFSGYTQYRQTDPDDETSGTVNAANNTSGTLTGTLVDVSVSDEQHHLTQLDDESSVGFMSHKEHGSDQHDEVVPAYHAYMLNPKEELRKYDGFYFYEPLQKIELVMEAGKYGTLVLPFEAEITPDMNIKAYRLTGVGEVRNFVIGDATQGTYQILEKEAVTETNAEGNIILKENTPYFIEDLSDNREDKITFTGQANNVGMYENSPEGNLLTGLFVSRNEDNKGYMDAGHWVLEYDEENDRPMFIRLTGTGNELGAYNAYIAQPGSEETPVAVKAVSLLADGAEPIQPQADELLIDEPEVTVPWTMDNQYVGTLMLPFDVDAATLSTLFEPYDMTACTIDEIGEWKETENHISYRVITTNAANSVTANTAYLVLIDSADRGDETDTQAEETTEATPVTIEFTGQRVDDETPVTTDKMLGVYENTSVAAGNYVACSQKYHEFKIVPEGGIQVAAYHAYVPADRITSEPSSQATYLVLSAKTVGVEEIMEGEVNVDIYTLDGVMVRRDVKAAEALQELDHGIYILRSAKGTVKVIK